MMADVSKINGYNVKDANAQAEIENIKNGKTIVQNARVALNANTATNYDTAGGTIKDKFTDHESKINNHQVEINNIKNGTTTVGKANNANTAAAATQANNYNTSTGTIKSKFDELEKKIGSGGSLLPAGSTNRPIYISSSGNPATIIVSDSITAAALTSSDTNLATVRDIYYGTPTINGSKVYTSSTSIYAPTTGGTPGAVLVANGTGAPGWENNFFNKRVSLYESTSLTTGTKSMSNYSSYNLLLCVLKGGSLYYPFLIPRSEFSARSSSSNKLCLNMSTSASSKYIALYTTSNTSFYLDTVSEVDGLQIFGM